MNLWIPAGVAFILAGILEIMFLGLSVLGTLLGGVMTVGSLAGELRNEEALLGPVLFVFYGVWMAATAIAGPLHLAAGVSIVLGKRSRKVLWAGTVVSLLPISTVYCGPSSVIAGVIGLLCAVLSAPKPEGATPPK